MRSTGPRSKVAFALSVLVLLLFSGDAFSQDRRGPFVEPPRSVRTRAFDLRHVRIELDLDWEKEEIRGRVVHTLSPFAKTERIDLDAKEMSIAGVMRLSESDGTKPLNFRQQPEKLEIDLDKPAEAGEEVTLAVTYRVVKPKQGGHFVPAKRSEPESPAMFWTQSEPESARYWFPVFDSPADRATTEVYVTVPENYITLSNGHLVEKKRGENGRVTWHWRQSKTHVPYLVSVVAGEFETFKQEWKGLEVTGYVPKGRLEMAERSFAKTPAMLEFFSEKIGYHYPWDKYAQICVDEYGWGGMEHTSATTLSSRTLHDERAALDVSSDGLVAHELAHQWWGDLLTCKDWGEIWLNESFATYFTSLWNEHDKGWDEAVWDGIGQANGYFGEDSGRYRRPIVTYRYKNPMNMFDSHSYPKGSRVLHMLRYVLGDEAFWKAIKHYAHKHEFGVVETADLRVAIEEATGQGLNWFFDQWVYRGGHPEYAVSYEWDGAEKVVRLTVKQTQTIDELTPLFRMPVEIDLVTPSGRTTRKITVSKADETFTLDAPERPIRVLFDPRNWILKKLSFRKSKEEWLGQLEDENVACRVQAIEALGESYRDDGDVRDALLKTAKSDKFWGVRKTAVEKLGKFPGDKVRDALIEAAKSDEKSAVRVSAIAALGDFPGKETSAALREFLAGEKSYFAAAEALKALVKTDRDGCGKELLAALETPSHQEVILGAAAGGLAELKIEDARPKLLAMLDAPSPAQRRVVVMDSLARLGRGKPEVTEALGKQLDDPSRDVRRAAVEALARTDDPEAVELLLKRKGSEPDERVISQIDDVVRRIREGQGLEDIRKELDALREKNRKLEERLHQLEENKAKAA